jgi:hypothetical protein
MRKIKILVSAVLCLSLVFGLAVSATCATSFNVFPSFMTVSVSLPMVILTVMPFFWIVAVYVGWSHETASACPDISAPR